MPTKEQQKAIKARVLAKVGLPSETVSILEVNRIHFGGEWEVWYAIQGSRELQCVKV